MHEYRLFYWSACPITGWNTNTKEILAKSDQGAKIKATNYLKQLGYEACEKKWLDTQLWGGSFSRMWHDPRRTMTFGVNLKRKENGRRQKRSA